MNKHYQKNYTIKLRKISEEIIYPMFLVNIKWMRDQSKQYIIKNSQLSHVTIPLSTKPA